MNPSSCDILYVQYIFSFSVRSRNYRKVSLYLTLPYLSISLEGFGRLHPGRILEGGAFYILFHRAPPMGLCLTRPGKGSIEEEDLNSILGGRRKPPSPPPPLR